MRAIILILSFCLYSVFCFSQFIVSNEKMNVVYLGVDNPIQFSVTGYNAKDLLLTSSCGTLRREQNHYIWKLCNEDCSSVKFTCYYRNNNGGKLLGNSEYRVRRIPNPTVHITYGDDLHYGELASFGPRADVEGFEFEVRFFIKSYLIEICKVNGDTLKLTNNGQAYNDDAKNELYKMTKGDVAYFSNFVVTSECDLGERRLLDKIKYIAH